MAFHRGGEASCHVEHIATPQIERMYIASLMLPIEIKMAIFQHGYSVGSHNGRADCVKILIVGALTESQALSRCGL